MGKYIKDLKIIKINNWTKSIQGHLNGRKQLGRPKFSSSELTAPDEEGDEEEASIILCLAH